MSPGLLTTEVTEASILRAEGRRASAAQRLRGLSSRVSLADFGSGYASLSMLTGLPLGEVKINQGLVRDMHGGGHQASVARAVAQFAGSLGLDAVAEGIETEAHLRACQGSGFSVGQGLLFICPQPAQRAQDWLDDDARFECVLAGGDRSRH